MDGVDVRVLQQLVVARVARLDAEAVADLVELLLVAPADGVHLGVRMALIDGNELGAEAEADDGDANLLVSGHRRLSLVYLARLVCIIDALGAHAQALSRRDFARRSGRRRC